MIPTPPGGDPSPQAEVSKAVVGALYADALMNPDMVKSCLVALLRGRTQSPEVRIAISTALARVCPDVPGVAESLAGIILNPVETIAVRLTAARVLEQFCDGPSGVGAFLRAILTDPSVPVGTRREAAFALRVAVGRSSESVRALARVLLDRKEESALRNDVASSLGKLGLAAGDELPSLEVILRDRDDSVTVRHSAAVAMIRIANAGECGAGTAPPRLPAEVADSGVWVSQAAMGETEDGSSRLLGVMLDRNDSLALRVSVTGAIGKMERPNADVSRVLTVLLQDRTEDAALRVAAISSLGSLQAKTGLDYDLTLERLMPVMSAWDELPAVNETAFRVLTMMGL
ncbi:MAG TPA: hypothetical protein VI893_03100 [Thermoplasmata archaeon]|nr:hypothetical protein [Thermoplasmata archaeon]